MFGDCKASIEKYLPLHLLPLEALGSTAPVTTSQTYTCRHVAMRFVLDDGLLGVAFVGIPGTLKRSQQVRT